MCVCVCAIVHISLWPALILRTKGATDLWVADVLLPTHNTPEQPTAKVMPLAAIMVYKTMLITSVMPRTQCYILAPYDNADTAKCSMLA